MTRDDLIKAVALRMDEVTPDNDYKVDVDGTDNNPLYGLINGLIEDSTLELFTIAPYWRLTQKKFTYNATEASSEVASTTVFSGDYTRKMIRLKMPDDFLRIAEINHTAFLRPITEVFAEQSDEGRRQHNQFLVGKTAKPVGVMSHGVWGADTICREIDCYSLPSDATVDNTTVNASYIAKPDTIGAYNATTNPDPVGRVVPAILIPALEWLIASRAFGARGDANHATICKQYAQNLLA